MSKVVLFAVILIVVAFIGPFLTIWSLNTLFPVLAIPFTLETWAAIILIGMFLKGNVTVKK
jgi:antibiotic biosynthesis monooxygenase (ABM) superfamily enzyme